MGESKMRTIPVTKSMINRQEDHVSLYYWIKVFGKNVIRPAFVNKDSWGLAK